MLQLTKWLDMLIFAHQASRANKNDDGFQNKDRID